MIVYSLSPHIGVLIFYCGMSQNFFFFKETNEHTINNFHNLSFTLSKSQYSFLFEFKFKMVVFKILDFFLFLKMH